MDKKQKLSSVMAMILAITVCASSMPPSTDGAAFGIVSVSA